MILMFGDVHGDFWHVLPAVEAEKPKAIIFLGDLQAQRPLEEELATTLARLVRLINLARKPKPAFSSHSQKLRTAI